MLDLKKHIADVEDFPKQGIVFKDISPLLRNPHVFTHVITQLGNQWSGKIDAIAGLDARGFLFGAPLAIAMKLPFTMLRKKGKLPGETIGIAYGLEYGNAELELQKDSFAPGAKVLLIDDLLATGGTARAACTLIEKSGASVVGCAFIAELSHLGGRKLLNGWDIHSLVSYGE